MKSGKKDVLDLVVVTDGRRSDPRVDEVGGSDETERQARPGTYTNRTKRQVSIEKSKDKNIILTVTIHKLHLPRGVLYLNASIELGYHRGGYYKGQYRVCTSESVDGVVRDS